jgi:hypothetical protein
VKLNKWLVPAGWLIFIVGILKHCPFLRQHGWAAFTPG